MKHKATPKKHTAPLSKVKITRRDTDEEERPTAEKPKIRKTAPTRRDTDMVGKKKQI